MYGCGAGKITQLNKVTGEFVLVDQTDGTTIPCKYTGSGLYKLDNDQTGIFLGLFRGGVFHVQRIDLRSFLEPLFEKDLLNKSKWYDFQLGETDPFMEVWGAINEKN